jgi:hypothetical protein
MTSAVKLAANRANARKSTGPRTAAGKRASARNALNSTGPKTAAGKARSARNALRHGLTRPASADPKAVAAIVGLAQAIAGGDAQLLPEATLFAAAHVDMQRVRGAQGPLYAQAFADPTDRERIRRLCATHYYQRLAYTREKLATSRLHQALEARLARAQASSPQSCENEAKPICENEAKPP